MKRKNLVRKKQLCKAEIDNLCVSIAIVHGLFMWSEDKDNLNDLSDLENKITDILRNCDKHNGCFTERIPLKGEN